MSRQSDTTGGVGLLVPELVTRAHRWAGLPVTLGNLLLLFGITFVSCCIVVYRERYRRLVRHIDRIPGPATVPIVGNALQINSDREELFNRIIASRKLYGRHQGISRIWNGLTPYVLISKAQVVEKILSSTRNIEKGRDYEFLQPWLGTGLLTSPASKWQHRRKILTPAFHFRILSDFVGVFNQQATVLARKLASELGNGTGFDCVRYITLCSLDIICETAMGCPVYAQQQSDSEYVRAHEKIGEIMLNRLQKLWLHPDAVFRCTRQYREQRRCLDILHGFSYRMIGERRAMIGAAKGSGNFDADDDDDGTGWTGGARKQLAFLDLLIEASDGGRVLSDADIREEVDTFILGGHDTTATAISWTLFLLGTEPTVQERAIAEIDAVLGGDRTRPPTMRELTEMRYLEACVKEALRLYPSIPVIGRRLSEDVQLDDYLLPAGTNAVIVVYQLHRDPAVFPNPDRFNPDHFLAEGCAGRHPFAYIPFSAGPRNCIGQKFGALEAKAVLVAVLRQFRVEAVDRREDLTLYGELVLRSKGGLKIRIHKRE